MAHQNGRADERQDTKPTDSARFHVSVVCSGNICRSPIGEKMLREAIERTGLGGLVQVSSAGTGDWHVGEPAHQDTRRALVRAGLPTDHRARQITREELRTVDLVLAADKGHLRRLRAMTDEPGKVRLLRSFDPQATGEEIPDPYLKSDSDFDAVVAMTGAAIPGILEEITARLAMTRSR